MELTISYLEKKFEIYNEKYFNGELIKPEFKIINTRSRLGCFKTKNIYTPKESYTIEISKYYDRNEFWYDNTLIHEMIHQKIRQFRIIDNGSHGRKFKAECARINADGWELKRTTDSSQWKLSNEAKKIQNSNNNKYDIIIFKENKGTQFIFKILKTYTHYYLKWFTNNNTDYAIIRTTDENFNTLPNCRTRIRGKRLYDNEVVFKKYML